MTSACDSADWLREVVVKRMTVEDLDEVLAIERESFPTAWSRGSYERELRNDNSHYQCARYRGVVVGYAGMWVILDEAHISTLAVHPGWRRRGLGASLLGMMVELARREGADRITLEVRRGNQAALAMYRQFGFEERGVLPGYYGDTGEDGIVMWKTLSPEEGRSDTVNWRRSRRPEDLSG